jgi:hypothetical protein
VEAEQHALRALEDVRRQATVGVALERAPAS